MYSITTATILLGMVHALIPSHWLPLVAVAKTERWSKRTLAFITAVASLAHVFGTVLLGLVLGGVGLRLSQSYTNYLHLVAPVLLILFGLIYFTVNLPHHHYRERDAARTQSKVKWVIVFALTMLLSPCLEVETLFLAAGAYGLHSLLWLGAVYAVVSITAITILVLLAFQGVRLIRAEFIEHHEKRITGLVLIAVGIFTFFVH